jgi:hypothetical protein
VTVTEIFEATDSQWKERCIGLKLEAQVLFYIALCPIESVLPDIPDSTGFRTESTGSPRPPNSLRRGFVSSKKRCTTRQSENLFEANRPRAGRQQELHFQTRKPEGQKKFGSLQKFRVGQSLISPSGNPTISQKEAVFYQEASVLPVRTPPLPESASRSCGVSVRLNHPRGRRLGIRAAGRLQCSRWQRI